MMDLMYNSCQLYTDNNDKGFRVVGLQIHHILISANNLFIAAEEKELKEVQLLAKNRKKLTLNTPIKFNGGCIRLAADNNLYQSRKAMPMPTFNSSERAY